MPAVQQCPSFKRNTSSVICSESCWAIFRPGWFCDSWISVVSYTGRYIHEKSSNEIAFRRKQNTDDIWKYFAIQLMNENYVLWKMHCFVVNALQKVVNVTRRWFQTSNAQNLACNWGLNFQLVCHNLLPALVKLCTYISYIWLKFVF